MNSISQSNAPSEGPDFSIFEATPGISFLLLPDDPAFTILAVSNDFIKFSGSTRAEVVDRSHFSVFPPNHTDSIFTGEDNLLSSFRHVLTHKQPHQLPLQRYDIPDQAGTFQERYWKIHNTPVLTPGGEVKYIIHSGVDITAQVKAQQSLETVRELEKAYDLFMQAPIIIGILRGDEYVIELANDSILQVWGRGREVVGKPLLEAIPEFKNQGFDVLLDQTRKTGTPYYAYEFPILLKRRGKEEVLYFDFVYQPYYDYPGQPIAAGVIGVGHEVTEQVLARKKVEELNQHLDYRNALFETLINATNDGILVVDKAGKILLHNKRFAEVWKLPPSVLNAKDESALLQHAMTVVVNPQEFSDLVADLYAGGPSIDTLPIPLNDGRVLELSGTPIIADTNLHYGWAWDVRDITDRIIHEQKFRNVVEQSPDPILILMGEDLVLEVANDALYELWQVGPDALGKPFLEILPEMQNQVFVNLLRGVLHTGESFYGYDTPAVFKRKDGRVETRYVNFSYQPYREADGRISVVLVMATDVTGQVIANQKLAESERNLRNMILQAPVAMCILKGPTFLVEIANDRMYELWGRPASDLLQKPLFEGLPEASEQGLEQILEAVYTTGQTVSALERPVLLPRNGTVETVYINFVYEPFREGDGSISGIMAVAVDVSLQVLSSQRVSESEERFRTLANSISQLAWIADAKGWVHWYNDRWFSYTGTTLEEMEGWGWQKVLHPEHVERVFLFVKEACQGDQPWELTFPLRSQDGAYRWFLTRGYPVKDAEGTVVRWIGTNTDINEQKQAAVLLEEKVRERTQELESKNRELEQFTYVSHHDLKEPIRKIMIYSELIKNGGVDQLPESSRRYLDRIIHAAGRMNDALKDVLSYASLTEPEQAAPVDLNAVLKDVEADLELVIAEKGARLFIDTLPTIQGVAPQLYQLFYNLINNALKFSKEGETPVVKITALLSAPAEEGLTDGRLEEPYYEIRVEDNGIGFEQDKAEKIFKMFQRLHNRQVYPGTGIGLALVRKVVLNHGGRIRAESQPGEGATFIVLLPAR